ncbi:MAG: type I-MYXAN CRISPR-associated protein Cas6/Cmx6 [Deltaproteobacteria bacterium]|nr:type I-MYXAN CRISPR-associated protein Cas6/Cmx6 [Deltaproteobacteria bacterium]
MKSKVDMCFPVLGKLLPVDHGFALYGAISRILPVTHEDREVGLKLLRGRYVGNGLLDISPVSELILRLPANRLRPYLGLAGKKLEVAGHGLRVGVPHTRALIPAVALYSPLVTTKNGQEPVRFEKEVKSQMASLGLKGRLHMGRRRTFQVHGKQVVGYEILVSELTAPESIRLQEQGLGGRRKMGCGFFEAWNKELESFNDKAPDIVGEEP